MARPTATWRTNCQPGCALCQGQGTGSLLRDFGCHQIQGYLFSRPLTAGQFTLFLAAHQPIAAAG